MIRYKVVSESADYKNCFNLLSKCLTEENSVGSMGLTHALPMGRCRSESTAAVQIIAATAVALCSAASAGVLWSQQSGTP